ncbi:SPARC-related modular calcium-binding protein 1 isoform X2 [Daktulosphaira vitifoliae]|uniref:SPARC-related modular calcium-binding protein 1 isoform X2 n=1 Tax=Daktulosphaira vitifoliae TaxID=58002 RepID=UPI0021AA341F|nr:SPARC-related modular calcium-binding protein 1 isoform X2 [Daktulosphaira vitifoliae]
MNFHLVAGLIPWMLLLHIPAGFSSALPHKEFDCKGRVERCERRKAATKRPVCGTDNVSYPNRCALLRVRCFNDSLLRVKHRGRCKEKQPCWVDQTIKTVDPNRTPDSYVPRCKADGTYFRIQCHKKEGYCWCVTPAGKVVPNTIVRGQKPKCDGGKGKWRRGSSKKGTNPTKECSKSDKAAFVNNLVRIFKTEYNREQYTAIATTSGDRSLLDSSVLEKRALEWKFNTLDNDRNNNLTKVEYRELKRLVRKVVRPKRCSRSFVRMCDIDHNNILSKFEWTNCLTVDLEALGKKLTTTTSTTTTTTTTTSAPIDDYEDKGGIGLEEADPEDILQESVATLSGSLPGLMAEGDQEEESEVNDCLKDRQEALDDPSASSHKYIPECTSEGRYKRVQCYKSVGYCWCAQEDNGKPIPGTSVKDSNPKCDTVPEISRPMKGCPDHKKTIFLKDLMNYLKQKHNQNNSSHSDYEAIITDIFHSLDTNHNKVLERKEWKSFREEMSSDSKLKQCGKKLPRHCDVDYDNNIGLTEWLNCLNVNHVQTQIQSDSSTSVLAKRRGPNPLESYLKGDD